MENLLSIDWWAKHIWIAQRNKKNEVCMPVGYITNDAGALFNLADIVERYRIERILIGYPRKQKDVQEKINDFIWQMKAIWPHYNIEKVNEDFTSVQAAAQTGDYEKARWKEDTIAAMKILEHYLEKGSVE